MVIVGYHQILEKDNERLQVSHHRFQAMCESLRIFWVVWKETQFLLLENRKTEALARD